MSQKPSAPAARESAVAPATKPPAERVVRDIRRRTRKPWSKEFLEAGKRRLAGDTARAATADEVKALRQEARALKG
jgi:hypothetical protein